jgi:pyruvate dehydrogenase E2 component (dihydrolipoamide acetyltransferase)
MPTNVFMPQMGESIAEGTIVRWVKKVGDRVDRDEPLFEISTDKVDAEIPSPAAGVLTEIRAKEGETIAVNNVVAIIDESPGAVAPAPTASAHAPAVAAPAPAVAAVPAPATEASSGGTPPVSALPAAAPRTDTPSADALPADELPADELRRQKSSPVVRRIAAEHGVDISRIEGSGIAGRVTKQDILEFIEGKPKDGGAAAPASVATPPRATGDEVVPMTLMRRRIAEHMIASRRTSAHVHSVFEIDFSRVSKLRDAKKAEYERAGAKLTYLPFIVKAVVAGLRAVPVVNSSIDGEHVIYHKDINIGIAVALDWGLIVPVVKQADEKSVLGLSRTMHDLADRARAKQLKPDEVQGGTFTITNPGVFGALFGMPIISQPQVAILGIGAVEKRVVVVDDAIAIRPMAYLSLGYDHRLIDGAVADQFMSVVKKQIETFDPASL